MTTKKKLLSHLNIGSKEVTSNVIKKKTKNIGLKKKISAVTSEDEGG